MKYSNARLWLRPCSAADWVAFKRLHQRARSITRIARGFPEVAGIGIGARAPMPNSG